MDDNTRPAAVTAIPAYVPETVCGLTLTSESSDEQCSRVARSIISALGQSELILQFLVQAMVEGYAHAPEMLNKILRMVRPDLFH